MLELNKIHHGDCLELMKDIPDGSVDMVLCDLPYGILKGIGLGSWTSETTSWDERLDTQKLFEQYERVCRENANIVLFSQEPYTSKLRNYNLSNIEFSYPLIWEKDSFGNGLMAKKAPVSYFEDLNVFYKKYDTQKLNPLREYSADLMNWLGCEKKQIVEVIGQKADHFFRVESTQYKLCTKSTYDELIQKMHIDCWSGFKTYDELTEVNSKFQRVFNLPKNKKSIGNILKFKKDYQGLHPTQKPVALCEYLIKIYTNDNEIVLDNCIGSGTTAIAALNTGRFFIGIEKEKEYVDIANKRIEEHQEKAIGTLI